jgi:hypothetical protein
MLLDRDNRLMISTISMCSTCRFFVERRDQSQADNRSRQLTSHRQDRPKAIVETRAQIKVGRDQGARLMGTIAFRLSCSELWRLSGLRKAMRYRQQRDLPLARRRYFGSPGLLNPQPSLPAMV